MRRKYKDCHRSDGDCTQCSLVNYGFDCHNSRITKLEFLRRSQRMTLRDLSDKSGINYRQIQKIEYGESDMDNITVKTLLALAKALDVDLQELI